MAPNGRDRRRESDERGQASVSFLAVVPALIVLCAVLVQLGAVGWSAWSAAGAARAAARAEMIGADPERAAEAALPGVLADRAEVEPSEGSARFRVAIRAPRLLPLLPAIEVDASAGYGAEAEASTGPPGGGGPA